MPNGVIISVESVDWCPQKLRDSIREELDDIGVESAFPKPFCALEETGTPVIDQFVREFQIGRPLLKAKVTDGVVRDVEVSRGSPCGSTWVTAHEVKGLRADDLDREVWRSHRGYPCTATTHIDPEMGEMFLNLSGQIILDAVRDAISLTHEKPLVRRAERVSQ
jgi:hypothetical protein